LRFIPDSSSTLMIGILVWLVSYFNFSAYGILADEISHRKLGKLKENFFFVSEEKRS